MSEAAKARAECDNIRNATSMMAVVADPGNTKGLAWGTILAPAAALFAASGAANALRSRPSPNSLGFFPLRVASPRRTRESVASELRREPGSTPDEEADPWCRATKGLTRAAPSLGQGQPEAGWWAADQTTALRLEAPQIRPERPRPRRTGRPPRGRRRCRRSSPWEPEREWRASPVCRSIPIVARLEPKTGARTIRPRHFDFPPTVVKTSRQRQQHQGDVLGRSEEADLMVAEAGSAVNISMNFREGAAR